jgi:hypothetical protein
VVGNDADLARLVATVVAKGLPAGLAIDKLVGRKLNPA